MVESGEVSVCLLSARNSAIARAASILCPPENPAATIAGRSIMGFFKRVPAAPEITRVHFQFAIGR